MVNDTNLFNSTVKTRQQAETFLRKLDELIDQSSTVEHLLLRALLAAYMQKMGQSFERRIVNGDP